MALIRLELCLKEVEIRGKACSFELFLPDLIRECLFEAPNLFDLCSEIGTKFKSF